MNFRPYELRDRDQVIALGKQQMIDWFGEVTPEQILEPDPRMYAVTLVAEDDEGRIVAALGAKRTVEIILTLDKRRVPLPDLIRKVMLPLWAKVAVQLYKLGYDEASCRVGEHIKKWGNTLVRRGGFTRESFRVFRFDLKKVAEK